MDIPRIRALAEEYAAQYNPQQVAPFPYENILKDRKDLEIFFADLEDDTSGVTIYKEGMFSILINNAKSEIRQHFTLGHELGHYFLHQDLLKQETGIVDGDETLENAGMLSLMDTVDKNRVETEANNFAVSLLMPAELVRRGWQATQSVEESASVFKVSVVAMSIRMAQLGLVSG